MIDKARFKLCTKLVLILNAFNPKFKLIFLDNRIVLLWLGMFASNRTPLIFFDGIFTSILTPSVKTADLIVLTNKRKMNHSIQIHFREIQIHVNT